MKFAILGFCVVAVAAKPHINLFNGQAQVIPAATYGAAVQKTQVNPAVTYGEPSVPVQSQQVYNGPPAPLDQDGRVIDTDEVAKLKAEHLAVLAKAHAEAAALEAMKVENEEPTPETEATSSSSSFGGYSYETLDQRAQIIPATTYGAAVQESQASLATTCGESSIQAQPEQAYNGPPAPLDQDGRVIDTDEVAKLKAEHLATLAKAHADAAAIEALIVASGYSYDEPTPETETTSSSSSSGVYSYEAPVQKVQVIPATIYDAAVSAQPQQAYNGPPAPLGPDGRVIDTEEVAKLKAELLATLAKANAEAAAIEAMEAAMGYTYEASTPVTEAASSSSSFGGYSYQAPVQKVLVVPATIYGAAVQKTHASPAVTYGEPSVPAQPQQAYNGPPAPLGPDGRVVDTEEVAKLKAELLATLAKANAEAAAIEAMEAAMGYSYEAPKQITEATSSSSSFGGYTYQAPVQNVQVIPATTYGVAIQKTQASPAITYGEPSVPAQQQQAYSVVPAPLDQDGRVIDTDEVAKLKAEHLAILAKAYSEVAAIEAMKAALAKSSSEDYSY